MTAGGETDIVNIRAWLLAERLDCRPRPGDEVLDVAPLALRLPDGGLAILFRYGAVVTFNATSEGEKHFLATLGPLLSAPLAAPEKEEARLRAEPEAEEQVDAGGVILVRDIKIERLQIVAAALTKNMILSHYEARMAAVFDLIDPLAADLTVTGRGRGRTRSLVRHIGRILMIQHRMVGRAEIGEKPELLWEHPELERLYGRLAEEYELRERDRALDRKLDVISRTVETLLGLVQSQSNMRVEWYITALIVIEIILSIFPPASW